MEKTFDRVWHNGLLHKLHQEITPTYLTCLIKSFLTNRKFRIKIGNHLSTVKHIKAGVPQGSCLSPLLYAAYINDLPTTPQAKIALFADDTLLYVKNKNANYARTQLQKQLNLSISWMSKWRL